MFERKFIPRPSISIYPGHARFETPHEKESAASPRKSSEQAKDAKNKKFQIFYTNSRTETSSGPRLVDPLYTARSVSPDEDAIEVIRNQRFFYLHR